jgi:hypothetical protein
VNPPSLQAQEFASLRGVVTDPAGGAISQVKIYVQQETTGLNYSTVSNEVGEYELQGLLPGTYAMTVEAPAGFKKFENTGMILYARELRRVDVQLALGSATESVTVREVGSVIQTDSASIIYRQPKQENYAINQQTSLIYTQANFPGGEARSQNHGTYANQNRQVIEGVVNNAYGTFRAPQEMSDEVKLISMNAPAEYQTATTITATSRRGSNQPHAEFFLNYVHPRLRALQRGQTERPPGSPTIFKSYDFSGPVYLPKIYDGRNRTFFRVLYQPVSGRTPFVQNSYTAPTAALRAGDFSAAAQILGRPIVDPLNGQPFPENRIPEARFNPVSKRILEQIPLPNFGPPGRLYDNTRFWGVQPVDEEWYHFRIDHQISSKNVLTFNHFRYNRVLSADLRVLPGDGGEDSKDPTRAISIQNSHTFSPRIVNTFTFSWNIQGSRREVGVINGDEQLRQLGITNLGGRTVPSTLGSVHINTTTVGNVVSGLGGSYNANELPVTFFGNPSAGVAQSEHVRVWQIRDAVSIQKARHLIKAGIDFHIQRPRSLSIAGDAWGLMNFTGNFTGHDFADFLVGLPFTTALDSPRPQVRARMMEVGWYIQDDFKVTSRLTLTPGVRFQHYGVPTDAGGLFYNFDLENQRVVVPDERALGAVHPAYPKTIPIVTAAQAGYPKSLVNFKRVLVEPRFGLAWRPFSDRMVFRMGYGLYHVPYAPGTAGASGGRGGLLMDRHAGPFQMRENFGPNQIINGAPLFTIDSPFPGGPGQVGLQNVTVAPLNQRTQIWPYDQQWNVTVEREFPFQFSGRASYVGTKGTNWAVLRNLQIPPPSTIAFSPSRRPYGADVFNVINYADLGGNSTYHGLELEAGRQFSSGLYFRGWYNWAKSLNDVQGGLFGEIQGLPLENPYNRAAEKGYQEGYIPHTARILASYELPFGRGKRFLPGARGFVNHLVGGWQVNPLLYLRGTSRWTPVFSGQDPANVGVSGGRADALCNPNRSLSDRIIYNQNCLALPPNGRFGNASRGSLIGPRNWSTFFSVLKTWQLTGRENGPYFKFEAYMDNVFSHSNDSVATFNIASGQFGELRPNNWEVRSIYFRLRIGF